MMSRKRNVNFIMFCVLSLIVGFVVSKCTTKPAETKIVEVEKPVEVVKVVEVEKPVYVENVVEVEKIVYVEVEPTENKANHNIYTETEMTESKAMELLETTDIYCYYVLDDSNYRLRNIFRKGDKFYKYDNMGKFPIVYSIIEL